MAKIGFDKKAFASFFSIVILGVLVFGGVEAIRQAIHLPSNAQKVTTPQAIQLVNVTEGSVSIFWQTQTPTTGFITYGDTTDLGKTKLDDRDRDSGQPQAYQNHLVTLSQLTPKTKYYYDIGVDATNHDRDGYPFIFFTSSPITHPALTPPLTARVLNRDGTPAKNYFITLTFEDSNTSTLSNTVGALTDASGTYTINLQNLRSADGIKAFVLSSSSTYLVDIVVLDELGKNDSQSITYSPSTIFPTIYFGKEVPTAASASPSAPSLLFSSPSPATTTRRQTPGANSLLFGTAPDQSLTTLSPRQTTVPHTPSPASLKLLF